MASTHVNDRVQKRRNSLRMAGLRPVQIWVPDTRLPHFADECRRQSQLIALADQSDIQMQQFMDDTITNLDGWTT